MWFVPVVVYAFSHMPWRLHRVTRFEIVGPYRVAVTFSDQSMQQIDLGSVLHGEHFGALRDLDTFNRVMIDDLSGTLKWPNGVMIDAAKLHDWPNQGPPFAAAVQKLATNSRRLFIFQKWLAVALFVLLAFNVAVWAGLINYSAFRPLTSVLLSGAILLNTLGSLALRRSPALAVPLIIAAVVALGFAIAAMSGGR